MSNLPFKADYAKSGRSNCHTTKSPIPTGTLRLATMIKSRNFDGMQPNWNDAKAFLTAKTRRKRPGTTDEIDGFDDLRPEDQNQIEEWIRQYTGTNTNEDAAALKHKKSVRAQSSMIWKIQDLTTGDGGINALPTSALKAILTENRIPIQGVSATGMVKLLAELAVFGVPSVGDKSNGCCGSRPLRFCPQTGRYVCKAPQAWGECAYSQSVSDTACQPLTVPPSKNTQEWLEAIKKANIYNGALLKPQQRLFIEKVTTVAQITPATSKKRAASSKPKEPAKKGKYKPKLSRACMDPECGLPEQEWHVLDEACSPDPTEAFPVDLYDTTLCKTDLSSGTNSHYKLQILVHDHGSATSAYLWRVWGRVGGKGGGGTKLDKYDSVQEAKNEFCKLFLKQTGNRWEVRKKSFEKKAGKFFQLDISYVHGDEDGGNEKIATVTQIVAGDPNSKLDPRVQEVVAQMFDEGIAATQLKDMKVDLAKMPLGKITDAQLKDAYSVLTEIEKVLQSSSTSAIRAGKLQQLSNQFYSKCPSTDPVLIDSMKLLKNQVEIVDELINLHASDSVMKDNSSSAASAQRRAPVDDAYNKLKTEFIPLDPEGTTWAMLKKYVENTRNASLPGVQSWSGNDWESRGLRLLDAFEINREGEANRFQQSKLLGNRRLLWHGSRISNYSGILSQGLRIAPPEAPVSGYRFGKGVYFADMLGKSANYCRTHGSSEMLVMACDVSLGQTFETSQDMYMEKPQPGTHSTHAVSEIIPNPSMGVRLADDNVSTISAAALTLTLCKKDTVLVPLGAPIPNPNMLKTPSCDVSEFIVYDQAQVHIRFLLRLTTNPSTKAADGTFNPSGATGTFSRASSSTLQNRRIVKASHPIVSSASGTSTINPFVDTGSDDDNDESSDSNESSTDPNESLSCFIRLDKEDRSRPSLSGLKMLNSRTFVEGLRLTVVRGDITESKTSAIVVPSDSQLSLTGMVGERVKQKAGSAFVDEINAFLYVPTQAKQTSQLPRNITRLDTTTAGKTIRELATDANVPYLTPFYKVVKKEDVSATKDVICIENSGAFHRGLAARNFIGMASGKKVSISPKEFKPGVEVFVQSSSHNRKMPASSAVLLETSMSATVPPPAAAPTLTQKSLQTSEACVIGGHDLPTSHVIFVVSPIFGQQQQSTAEAALKLAIKNTLLKCSELGLKTVTLPSVGSGRAGYDKGKAASWIIEAIAVYLENAGTSSCANQQSLEEVCFCLFDDESLEAYRQGIDAYRPQRQGRGLRIKKT